MSRAEFDNSLWVKTTMELGGQPVKVWTHPDMVGMAFFVDPLPLGIPRKNVIITNLKDPADE